MDLALTEPRQISILADPGIRIVAIRMRGAGDVPLLGGLEGKKSVKHLRMSLWISPVFRDLGPFGSKARFVDVAVLNDQRMQLIGVRQNDAEADRCAVIVKVHGIMRDLQLLQKITHRLGKMIERVSVGGRRRRVAQTESGIIRGDQMIFCRKQGNECVKLTRRRREAMQEQNSWGVFRAGFPVENPDSVDLHAMIGRRSVGRREWCGLCCACKKACGKNVMCYAVHYDVPSANNPA